MGKVKNTRVVGNIGGIVITKNGVAKSKPYGRKKIVSEKLKASNMRFKGTVDLYNKVKHTIVKPIWRADKDSRVNTFNLFVKRNIAAFNSEGGLQDPKMLTLTAGELPVPFNVRVLRNGGLDNVNSSNKDEDYKVLGGEKLVGESLAKEDSCNKPFDNENSGEQGTITVRWFNDKADDARRLDDRLCLIYLTANSFSPVCETEFMRKDSKVHLPVYCKGEKSSYIYIFFKEENYGIGSQDRFSDSLCIKTED